METIKIGQTLTCAETGKQFVAAIVGCTTNYATDSDGNVYSDEGVDICEKRELLDRTKPFYAYISCDNKRVTGWKGNVLMTVTSAYKGNGGFGKLWYYQATDIHGGKWYGKGSGSGMCITMRPKKGQ